MKRKTALLLVLLMMWCTSIQVFAAVQTNADKWAVTNMEAAFAAGFLPEAYLAKAKDEISRLEFCKIAVGFYEKVTGKKLKAKAGSPFSDCDDESVVAAFEIGIIGGVEPGKFAPEKPLTREQMTIIIARTLALCGLDLTEVAKATPFADTGSLTETSKNYISRLYGAQIISGMEKDIFAPFRQLTVQEGVSAFVKAYLYYEKSVNASVATTPPPQEEAVPPAVEKETPPKEDIPPKEETPSNMAQTQNPALVVMDNKPIHVGETIQALEATWGTPDRMDETVYGLKRYVYVNDYVNYFFVTVKDEKIIEFFTPGTSFTYLENQGKITSAEIKNMDYVSTSNHSGVIEEDGIIAKLSLDYEGKVCGLLVQTKEFAVADSFKSGLSSSLRGNIQKELLEMIQVKRKEVGLPLLKENDKMERAALAHSQDMAKNSFLDYVGSDGSTPFSRISENGMAFVSALEVVAKQRGDVVNIYQEWVKMPARLTGLLDADMEYVGVGAQERSKELYITVDLCSGLKYT